MSSVSQGSGDVQWIDSNIQGINELKREIDKSEDIAFNKFVEKITKKSLSLSQQERKYTSAREKLGSLTGKVARAFARSSNQSEVFTKAGLLEAKALLALKQNEYREAVENKKDTSRILRHEISDLKKEIRSQTKLIAKSDKSLKTELKLIDETAKKIGDLKFKFKEDYQQLTIDRDSYGYDQINIEREIEKTTDKIETLKTTPLTKREPTVETRLASEKIRLRRSLADHSANLKNVPKNIRTDLEQCANDLVKIQELKDQINQHSSSAKRRET